MAGASGSYSDFNLALTTYCYQIRVSDPQTGAHFFSNQVSAAVGSSDTMRPTSTSAVLTASAGFADRLDTSDSFVIDFAEAMTVSANARIRVTDGDCGVPPSQSSGPVACQSGSTQTIADILCGTNATCVKSVNGLSLTVTMTAPPTEATPGSGRGVSFPAVITDTVGITDLAGNLWDLTNSPDRMIGPSGQ
jgi:hypothetical protein